MRQGLFEEPEVQAVVAALHEHLRSSPKSRRSLLILAENRSVATPRPRTIGVSPVTRRNVVLR